MNIKQTDTAKVKTLTRRVQARCPVCESENLTGSYKGYQYQIVVGQSMTRLTCRACGTHSEVKYKMNDDGEIKIIITEISREMFYE